MAFGGGGGNRMDRTFTHIDKDGIYGRITIFTGLTCPHK